MKKQILDNNNSTNGNAAEMHLHVAVLCFFVSSCFAQYSGLELRVTKTTFTKILDIAEPMVNEYIQSIEPLKFGPYPFFFDRCNLTSVKIQNISYSSFTLDLVPGVGISINLGGFEADMPWSLEYDFLDGWQEFDSVASLNQTNLTIVLQISEENSVPSVRIANSSVSIGLIDVGKLPSEIIRDAIDTVLRAIIMAEAPAVLSITANADLAALIPALWGNGTTTVLDMVAVNYSLSQQPVFTNDYMSFYVDGSITLLNSSVTVSCPYIRKPFPPPDTSHDIELAIDISVIECIIYQFALQELSLHNYFTVDVQPSQPIAIAISEDNLVTISIGAEVSFYRNQSVEPKQQLPNNINSENPADDVWLSLVGNVTLSFGAVFSLSNQPGNSYLLISFPNVTQLLKVDSFSSVAQNPAIPQFYKDQLQHEQWGNLVDQVNKLIVTAINGRIPPVLGLPVPDSYVPILQRLTNLGFSSSISSLTVMIDILVP